MKNLREENASLRNGISAKEAEVERLLRFIYARWPDRFDAALTVLVDPARRGWKKFRSNWLHRLGVTT